MFTFGFQIANFYSLHKIQPKTLTNPNQSMPSFSLITTFCECGGRYTPQNERKHRNSSFHFNNLRNLNLQPQEDASQSSLSIEEASQSSLSSLDIGDAFDTPSLPDDSMENPVFVERYVFSIV